MEAQKGQISDLKKAGAKVDKVIIICEAGNDNGETFKGEFLAKCGRLHYRINNGILIKKIAV